MQERHSPQAAAAGTAVIVAAGNGTRFGRGRKGAPPKPLFRLGGLRLIERVIVTLRSRGIERFRIVVGHRADEVVSALRGSRTLRKHGIAPEFVRCPDFQEGNGHSLACGSRGLDEPFLLAMCDHVYDPRQVERLLEESEKKPRSVLLVTDPEPERTFDLDDATKVLDDGSGAVTDIGKDIRIYSQIDTGLFYFPAGAPELIEQQVEAGSHGISGVLRAFIRWGLFSAVPVRGALWQDVDDDAMARRAEAMLLGGLVKPTDGFVSRHLNRKLSLPVTALLARLGATPNQVTAGVLVIGLLASALAFFPDRLWLAGLLFQLASILDGTDGELSRLTWSGSKSGAWFDSLCDAVRYMSFYAALGIGLALHRSFLPYAAGTIVFGVLSMVSVVHMVMHLRSGSGKAVFFAVGQEIRSIPDAQKPRWQRWSLLLTPLFKLDVLALLTMALLLAGLAPVVFGIAVFCAVLMSANVFHLIRSKGSAILPQGGHATPLLHPKEAISHGSIPASLGTPPCCEVNSPNSPPAGFLAPMALETGGRSTLRDEPLRVPPSRPANRLGALPPERLPTAIRAALQARRLPDWGKTIFSIAGLTLLAAALTFVPWEGVSRAIVRGGWGVLLVFIVPLGWLLANTAGLKAILGGCVSFPVLLYNRLVGEALNASIPMANLGGEPYKIFHLSRYTAVEKALSAVVSDKIVSVASGLIFSGAMLLLGAWLPGPVRQSAAGFMLPVGILSAAAGVLLALAPAAPLLGPLCSRLLRLVRRGAVEIPRLEAGVLLRALAWNLAGRALLLAEFAGFLLLLGGRFPDAASLILLTGLTSLLGQVFFMIPQGLGVNEAGITGAMVLMGWGPDVGMAVALLRRGRMVFWAAVGLGLLGAAQGVALLRKLIALQIPEIRSSRMRP